MELSIDTSTRYAGVAISLDGQTLVEMAWRSEQNHSVELLPSVQRLMEQLKISVADLSCIFVARGPGSFSALRVGIATAKGIALARAIPLVGVGTLDMEAYPYVGMGRPVYAVVGAGRDQAAVARYEDEHDFTSGSSEPWLASAEEVVGSVQGQAIFCGEGAAALASKGYKGTDVAFVRSVPPTRKPSILAHLGYQRFKGHNVDDTVSIEPIYLRGPSITKSKRWNY